MQTGPRPSSSPSSYPADTSLLHRAVREGWSTLAVPPEQIAGAEEERGRKRQRSRWSISSNTSRHLSPAIESVSESEAIQDDDDDENDVQDERTPFIDLQEHHLDPRKHTIVPALLPNPAQVSETTPLLATGASPSRDIPTKDAIDWRIAARQELKILLSYTVPIVGTHVLEFSLMMCTVISPFPLSLQAFSAVVADQASNRRRSHRHNRAGGSIHLEYDSQRHCPFNNPRLLHRARHFVSASIHVTTQRHEPVRSKNSSHSCRSRAVSSHHLVPIRSYSAGPATGSASRRKSRRLPQSTLPWTTRLRCIRMYQALATSSRSHDPGRHHSRSRRELSSPRATTTATDLCWQRRP